MSTSATSQHHDSRATATTWMRRAALAVAMGTGVFGATFALAFPGNALVSAIKPEKPPQVHVSAIKPQRPPMIQLESS